jgi:antitoxin (DNA-binding transcriptional repressor) of toxin-antitoxin stability system
MVELREPAEEIIGAIQEGQRMVLSYRGRPVARLEPIPADAADEDDPSSRLAEPADGRDEPLTNDQIDEIVYGLLEFPS